MKLYDLTAHEIRDMLRKKEVSCREVTENILDRIAKVEPYISSYITINDEGTLSMADNIDKLIKNGEDLGDLAGIPMALKDNICTDGILTTCGSKMLQNFVPPYNATCVERLYNEKSILIGKTNMDEFAMGSSTENSAFKPTRNPWDLSRVPGGSSGGSAASVAAGEAFFALGSDTGGSIRQPAALCGLVGLKPTYGMVSRYGLVSYASSLDQIGTLTKDVEDCALVMNVIAGYDFRDSTSVSGVALDYKEALIQDVKGLKIGIPREYFYEDIDIDIKKAVYEGVKVLCDMGAEYEEMSLPYTEYNLATYFIIASSECSSNLARYDGIRYGYRASECKNLNDVLIKSRSEGFGEEVKRRIMAGTYSLSFGYYDEYYKRALKVRTLIKNDFAKAFEKYDVLITPTSPHVAFKFNEKTRDPLMMYKSDICTVGINIAGLPAISICCGFKNHLPIGLQIIGRHFDEKTILRVAYTFEQNTKYHKKRAVI
ncbi:Asp-tRNA(Asn)/Glu-tRNA(Gln) amidotransferase subunit GatA [Paramaledivibacter caminithermalis]|jgi:aspartyl-tRNA(Asn)/glutamyl-tRNA(Gln) amidotransferase subunit A|uniref:Glutamyl-tRNA(Gln) amidotransferase subunit A n=1 Tax=Paramaledivibacter caminithermalis (strain DSM 15212 / CIP 107654 / DViRD3) TaxID=1121301 RepID=A0A1M6NTQ3_PARC5|nr:Asp-tRNA(Asn)/Glu-tRNA(Gln) amidotransferase subunit GatA [Paramaledivibacter caminithermalis]SHJ99109.1 aspartyl/glutamyl-tRNA(Asn/Gln) amidotransferase subunit A [Paramaledivibacter caminithermalis DSM 15212]